MIDSLTFLKENERFAAFWESVPTGVAETAAVAIYVATRHPEWARYWASLLEQFSTPEVCQDLERIVLTGLSVSNTDGDNV